MLDVGRSFPNFSAGFVDGATSALTLGHWSRNIVPIYQQGYLQSAYGIGQLAGHIEAGLATGAARAALKGAALTRFGAGALTRYANTRLANVGIGAVFGAARAKLTKGSESAATSCSARSSAPSAAAR